MERILLPMQEAWVQSLGGEDPLEEEMATHSSILAWRIPWTEEPGGRQSMGSQRVRHEWVTEHSCTHPGVYIQKKLHKVVCQNYNCFYDPNL